MKLYYILAAFLLSGSIAWTKNPASLGIGFAVAEDPYRYVSFTELAEFYEDKGLSNRLSNADHELIAPYFYKTDYGLLHFICLEQTDRYFKVLLNDAKVGYLKRDGSFKFLTWSEVLAGASVRRNDLKNPIYVERSQNSSVIKVDCDREYLRVKELREENGTYWMRIGYTGDCDPYANDENLKEGWIQWRKNDQLLVQIFLLC